jgi:hypothetical protein
LVEEAGAQGVEFLNWMAMRGALTGRVTELHRNYHVPISKHRCGHRGVGKSRTGPARSRITRNQSS